MSTAMPARRAARALGMLAALLLGGTAPAAAQEAFPTRPVRFIVPFAPGGSNDFTARLMAPRMAAALGQPVVIETRSGAGGVTGVDVAAKAPPDGHTIVLGTAGSIVIGPLLRGNQPFDPLRDLAAVTLAINVQVPVAVPARSPYRSLQELLAAARASPGRITFGSSGTGGLPHLAGELIREAAGVEMVHVPYRGGAPLSLAVVAGEVEMGLSDLPVFLGPARDGAVRILAVGSPRRLPLLPEVPTLREIGLEGVDTSNWHGVVTAAGVPPTILDRLQAAAAGALRDPEVVRAIEGQGMEVVGNARAEFAALIATEVPRWAAALRRANVRPD